MPDALELMCHNKFLALEIRHQTPQKIKAISNVDNNLPAISSSGEAGKIADIVLLSA